jgi:hypothetical protein
MGGTVSSGRKADRQAGTARGGSGRRWVVAGVVIVVVVAGVAVAAAAGAFKGSGSAGPGAAGTAYRTSVATVTVTCPVFRRGPCQGSLAERYGPGRAADSTAAANAAMDGNSQSGVTGAGG